MATSKFFSGQSVLRTGRSRSGCKTGQTYTVREVVYPGGATERLLLVGLSHLYEGVHFEPVHTAVTEAAPEPEVLAEPEPDTSLKPTNPKDAIGNRKLQLGLLPFAFQAHASLALTDGKYKYGAHNWTIGGVRASIYIDAALRHIARFNAGQLHDPDSRIHNLGHAAACLAILLDAEARGVLNDDRPPAIPTELLEQLQVQFNDATGRLIDTHVAAGRAPHHWTILDGEGSGDAD